MTFSVSPSSLSTFRLCQRRWAWSAIDRIPREQAASAALGERVHAIVEAWLRDGKAPDLSTVEGAIAGRALKHLPKPTTCEVEIEGSFEYEDLLFQFRIDHLTPDMVGDLKTTGDMRWAKTPEQLVKDEQAIVYSKFHMLKFASDLPPALRWTYTKTKGAPSARKVDATLSAAEVEEGMQELLAVGRLMRKAKETVKTALELEPNPSACRAFGGCPHVERCGLTNQQKMKGYMKMASLKEKLKSINAPQPTPKEPQEAKPDGIGTELTEGAPTTNENPFRKRVAARATTPDVKEPPTPTVEAGVEKLKEKLESGASPAEAAKAVTGHAQPFRGIGNLYINALPLDGTFLYAETAFAAQMKAVAEEAGVPHYRAVDYGKGPAYLVAAVEAELGSRFIPDLVIDLRTDLGRDLVGALRERALRIVQGF